MSLNGMDKKKNEIYASITDYHYLALKKKGSHIIFGSLDEPGGYGAGYNKPIPEGQTPSSLETHA